MLFRIEHETRLTYTAPVSDHVCEVRKAPQSDDDQTALGYRLRLAPPAAVTGYYDGFGNRVDLFNVAGPTTEMVIRATNFVRTHRRPAEARLADAAPPGSAVAPEAVEFLQPSPLAGPGPALEAFVAGLPPTDDGPLERAVRVLMESVAGRLRFEKKATTARTPVGEALALGCGVCQDFAHLFLAACRRRGIPARYVSGYVHQPGEIATHAWCQVWGGPAGWIDVDPTHRCLPADDHIVTAVGRDFSDVPPNRGFWNGAAEESITVLVKVEPAARLPADWTTLDSPAGATAPPRPIRRVRGEGPNHQPPPRPSYRQQQSQQQQSRVVTAVKPSATSARPT